MKLFFFKMLFTRNQLSLKLNKRQLTLIISLLTMQDTLYQCIQYFLICRG